MIALQTVMPYNRPVTSKKGVIGIGILRKVAKSHTDLSTVAFLCLVSLSMSGLGEEPQGSPVRFPGMPTRSVPLTQLALGVRIINLNESEYIMNALTLGTSSIRELDGLYSLNDLHKAAAAKASQKPSEWLRNQQTQELLSEIQIAGIPAIQSKQGLGTYACRELVIAYAAWISAAFHLKVIRVFLNAQAAPKPMSAPSLLNRRWLVSFDHLGREHLQPIDFDDCLLKYEELPKLLAASDNLVSAELLTAIAHACIERLHSKTQGLNATIARLRAAQGVKPSFSKAVTV